MIISDGGVAALVACVAAREAIASSVSSSADGEQAEPAKPIVWMPAFPKASLAARRHAVARQCEALDLELLPHEVGEAAQETTAGERASRMLVSAAYAALHRGCNRVVWPVHFDENGQADLTAVADALDRALLVTRLVALDAGGLLRVDVPFADFTDRQVAELVIDMDVPVKTCWWWHAQSARTGPGATVVEAGEEFRAEHRRWTTVLREVGWVFELAGA